MIIDNYINLVLMTILPVVVCIVSYLIEQKWLKRVKYFNKQIIFGVVFGIVAILETEFAVQISGAAMNVRDCPVICAGLVFGAPAGIIAGVIGGVERWFAIYWGIGTYTRVACTIGTILAGLLGAMLRVYIFENRIPKTIYALVAGAVAEVMHMLLIFVTHISDATYAFEIVKTCSIPMITANAVGTFLAILIVNIIKKEKTKKSEKLSISQLYQRRLLIVVLIAFVITNLFNYAIQMLTAWQDIQNLLELNIEDTKSSAESYASSSLLRVTNAVALDLNKTSDIKLDTLVKLRSEYQISEINIINKDGIIELSTNDAYIDFDMMSGEQSYDFFSTLKMYNSYVQPFTQTSYSESIFMKYAGVALKNNKYVQVGYNSKQYYESIKEDIHLLALNRHIGQKGHIIVAKMNGDIVSDYYGSKDSSLNSIGIGETIRKQQQLKLYQANIYGEDVYYEFSIAEGYYFIATQPKAEALQNEIMSLYLTTFLEVLVFAGIFILSFFVIKGTVVENVKTINKSLKRITDGKLDTVVDVRDNKEFDSLSTGINSTVNRLKELIGEAKERMKKELEYAADIQRSALPSNFPAFPDRDDIDIFASMDPAKEVGGDFYDFYFVDSNKLAILVADVSGKGVPASLFMMRSKTIIKSYAEYGIAVNDVFTNANFNLCEGNETGLFVTAWMGVIDLETGHMDFANAGHNPPLIKKPNGTYEYLRTKPGFVLGGMEGVAYKLNETNLEPGTEIFLYTDGLTEAQNTNKELYGENRLYNAINLYSHGTSQSTCSYIKKDVDDFVGEADQFDDLTMLHLKFIKRTFDE